MCIGFFFRGWIAVSPAVALVIADGKNSFCGLSLSSKKYYRFNITFLSVFYHDCIKTFCKERHFTQEGKRKNAAVGKPCGGRNKGIAGKEKQPELSRLPVCFLSIVSEKVIIFDMLHYILNIAMQNVT